MCNLLLKAICPWNITYIFMYVPIYYPIYYLILKSKRYNKLNVIKIQNKV